MFGTPKGLPINKLPTGEKIIRCSSQERYNLALQINKCVSFKQVASTVTNKQSAYTKKRLSLLLQIKQLITALHDKYYSMRKSNKQHKNKASFKMQFKQKCLALFDVAACKSLIVVVCTCNKKPDLCQLLLIVDVKKVPPVELRFVYLQRVLGIREIGVTNVNQTSVTKHWK